MPVFNSSKMSTLSASGWDVDSCDVRIDGDSILVAYRDGPAQVFYRGKQNGPGHFELAMENGDGKATLHQFPGRDLLEGWWVEDGELGAWRIELRLMPAGKKR